jgi:hypothetical protein
LRAPGGLILDGMTIPDPAGLSLLDDAVQRAATYLEHIAARPVTPLPAALEALRELAIPLPETALEPPAVLATLDRIGSPATMASNAGRYFGFVNGGVLPAAMAASWMVSTWDRTPRCA